MHERWFESVTSGLLEQGDLLPAFPIVQADLTSDDIVAVLHNTHQIGELHNPAEIIKINAIVMTQSCDLQNEKVDSVLLCPYWTEHQFNGDRNKKEQIRKGNVHGWHLLNSDEILRLPYLFVEFSRLYTAPKASVATFVAAQGARPRLISPYKEHLSQAFARFFMRVGLPSGIPAFK